MQSMNENDLQILILDALHASGITAWLTHKIGAYHHKPIIKGISDILGILTEERCVHVYEGEVGRFLAIEVKLPGKIPDPKNKLSKTELDQIAFLDEVNHAGGIGFFADSLEMVIERLDLPLKV